MFINSLYYKNLVSGLVIEETHFSDFNLLVGVSGSGKTQILKALGALRDMALGKRNLVGVVWRLNFTTLEGNNYLWEGEIESPAILTHVSNLVFDN